MSATHRVLEALAAAPDAATGTLFDSQVVAAALHVTRATVTQAVYRLCQAGSLKRVGTALYRVTGSPYAGAHSGARPPAPKPIAIPDCTYATARGCGIEPVIRMVRDRNSMSDLTGYGPPTLAVTLPRVRFLEG